jgi:hypothetical protein
MGLGLTISKLILQNLGGHLEVKSKVGEGSCFKFAFPIEKFNLTLERFETEEEVVRRTQSTPIEEEKFCSNSMVKKEYHPRVQQPLGDDHEEATDHNFLAGGFMTYSAMEMVAKVPA